MAVCLNRFGNIERSLFIYGSMQNQALTAHRDRRVGRGETKTSVWKLGEKTDKIEESYISGIAGR